MVCFNKSMWWFHAVLFVALATEGCSKNEKNGALIEAASNGDVAGCERLVTGGLAVDAVDSSGDTALDWAVYNCKTEVVRKLLALGANANRVDLMGRTPLVYTATALRGHKLLGTDRERSVIAQLLVANKAEVNHACPDGQTALHFAARGKNVELVTVLLASGARRDITDTSGLTPLQMAKDAYYRPNDAVIKLLEAAETK